MYKQEHMFSQWYPDAGRPGSFGQRGLPVTSEWGGSSNLPWCSLRSAGRSHSQCTFCQSLFEATQLEGNWLSSKVMVPCWNSCLKDLSDQICPLCLYCWPFNKGLSVPARGCPYPTLTTLKGTWEVFVISFNLLVLFQGTRVHSNYSRAWKHAVLLQEACYCVTFR